MKAVFSNQNHPEYGVATIPFPISKAEYDNCIGILNALEVGDVLAPDCKIEEIGDEYPVVQRLVGSEVNVDELDYLVKRMESFHKRELGQFQAVAASQNIHTVRDFINLTFCCQNVTIVQDFSNLKQIGEFCYMAKYPAAVLFTEPTTATELKNLAEQLDLFDFILDIRTPEEYGKHMICESGHFEYDENLSGHYDFEKYGKERMDEPLASVQCERMKIGVWHEKQL